MSRLESMIPDTSIVLRAGRRDDAASISALLRATAGNCVPEPEAWIRTHAHRFLVATPSDTKTVVAAAALLPAEDGALSLRSVAVAREFRGRGLARAVLEPLLCDELARSIDVWCRTTQPAFFERYGFRPVSRHRGFDGRERIRMKRAAFAPTASDAVVDGAPSPPIPSPSPRIPSPETKEN
ncbi:MAG: GNAT family N-acetyltransferase [bacterium]|nr:GNAT family N-acetyltransferase [bacterium]